MAKVLVFGIDAMDPKIFNKLKDKLPNFSKLEFSELQTSIPPETPVAWSVISTGLNPGKFGIFDFINRDPETYTPQLNLAREKKGIVKSEYICAMKGTPFWRILSKNHIPCTVIRWPVTFPPEKIDGNMLSGLGVVDIKGMLNSYSYYTDEKIDENDKGKEKIVVIEKKGKVIDTFIRGPFIIKKKERREANADMVIELEEKKIQVKIKGKKYELEEGKWSEIISAGFKLFSFLEVSGIFQFYLESITPFRMYMTSVMIDPTNQILPITQPKEYGKELVETIGHFYTLGMAEDTKAVTENKLSLVAYEEQVTQIEEQRTKMLKYELERFEKGMLAVVFDAGDRLNHIFWSNKVLEGNKKNKKPEGLDISPQIEKYYLEKDKLLGEVMTKLDSDDKLIVLSDHGFNSFEQEFNLNTWLVKEGYMKSKGDVGEMFDFVDWTQTKAYGIVFTSLYINQQGREGQGIVKSEEKEKIIEKIQSKLLKIKHNGIDVFTNVYKGSEVFKGEYSETSPDLVVGFNQGFRMSEKSAIGTLDKEVIFENTGQWKGDHLIDRTHVPGVLFTNFKIAKEKPSILDIAPTVLKSMGVNIPEEMDGEALI
ncbi:MAG: alkaline phosphatase family protein [Nanoarchaeota archaeon]|nr:alkaline phosphatase family protein [Nanoarchaeota archaeon]